jgi:serine/threonine-protein kinase
VPKQHQHLVSEQLLSRTLVDVLGWTATVVTTADPQEADQLRYRVLLYVQVMLVIDLLGWVSDVTSPLLFEGIKTPIVPFPVAVLRFGVTVFFVVAWLFLKFVELSRSTLAVLESGLTVGLAAVYVKISLAYFNDVHPLLGPVFAMLGIALLLVVRTPLVPSSVARTAVVGIASVASLFVVAYDSLGTLPPVAVDGLSFVGGAFVVATAVTSHVIYGLRRQVRDAMRLGQYQLGRKLGEGGMGVVHEATHLMLRRPTAVKLLPIEKAGAQTVARFEREVQQTSRLEHPNSVSIYDYGRTPDGQFYYAMELVDGITLQQLVEAGGTVPAARAASILRQAALALAEAHARGLVHRDIKPANIMLCERARIPDTVKVLDFGLVKALDDPAADREITQANSIVGTPHFLAPEAISNPDDVGAPSDIYALGAIGFYLLTGRDVFTGDSVVEVCSKHLRDAPESPSAVRGKAVDPGFEALILRCLAKAPGDRPADGAALAELIDELGLTGWTLEEADAWWREHREKGVAALDSHPTPTRLAVDVEGRR